MAQQRRIRGAAIAAALVAVLVCGGIASGSESTETYLEASGAVRMQASGFDGRGITVAIIDTGVADVPGLDGAVIHQENLSAAPAEGDQFGHGTFVAGIVHKVSPQAKIVSIKLSGADGSVDVTQVLAALQWVALNKERFSIDVVNLSFGNDSKQSWRTSPVNFAVQQVWDAGIVVVASAGNAGDSSGTVTKPADDPLVISVGSTDDQGTNWLEDDTVPSFVSRGPTQDGLTKPDLAAPGSHVVSLRAPGSTADVQHPEARVGESGFRGTGTSFSAPVVTGIAANLLSAVPNLTPNQVKFALMDAATPVNGDALAQGAGTVRGMRSYRSALEVGGHANANVGRSSGQGSLDAARGSMKVKKKDLVATATGELVPVLDTLDGLETTQNHTFNQDEFTDRTQWDASQWGASQWGASQWGASQWGAALAVGRVAMGRQPMVGEPVGMMRDRSSL